MAGITNLLKDLFKVSRLEQIQKQTDRQGKKEESQDLNVRPSKEGVYTGEYSYWQAQANMTEDERAAFERRLDAQRKS